MVLGLSHRKVESDYSIYDPKVIFKNSPTSIFIISLFSTGKKMSNGAALDLRTLINQDVNY